MSTIVEVICYGSVIPDRVLRLPHFPQPGEGVHALNEKLYLGGEPCNVGGHLRAWNVSVAVAGNNVGADPLGEFVQAQLRERQYDVVTSRVNAEIQTPTCYIWTTPDGERTIVPSWPTQTGWSLPPDDLIENARLVSVSVYGPGMDEMLAVARRYNKPLAVADPAGPHDPRLAGAVIITTSEAVLRKRHGITETEVDEWMRQVHSQCGALVLVSVGARPARAITADGRWLIVTPPPVSVVDTTGAGDALKAGMILGWLRNWSVETTLQWAVAAASLQCTQYGPCELPAASTAIEQLMSGVILQASAERTNTR
jgi:ribokinase